MKLRICESMWTLLQKDLLSSPDIETAGLLLAEPLQTSETGPVLVARAFEQIPEAGYLERAIDRLVIDPITLNRKIRPARERGWSVLTVHSHPKADRAWFSYADDAGDAQLMPALGYQVPGVPHGSIVIASSGHARGRFFLPKDQQAHPLSIRVIGRRMLRFDGMEIQGEHEEWFDRQQLALGPHGQQQLRSTRIGIIGIGGTGSGVMVPAAHLGIGEIVIIDPDRIEPSNISRILGATTKDVGRFKVDVLKDYVDRLGLNIEVTALPKAVEGGKETEILRSCDILFSCVDRETPRAILNRLAYDASIPIIDMGTAFRLNELGHVSDSAGRVVVLGPDRPCMACWGDLDPETLRIESLPPEARENEIKDGYIMGAQVQEPSVVAFNAMVSAAATIEFLRLVTGFAGAQAPPNRLAFSFERATVQRNQLAGLRPCQICQPDKLIGEDSS